MVHWNSYLYNYMMEVMLNYIDNNDDIDLPVVLHSMGDEELDKSQLIGSTSCSNGRLLIPSLKVLAIFSSSDRIPDFNAKLNLYVLQLNSYLCITHRIDLFLCSLFGLKISSALLL